MSCIIGIDLGTTQSTLAYCDPAGPAIHQFEIDQRIAAGMEAKKSVLPSFYLFPLEEQKPCIGWYARERGAELPDRVIASAKSWLCHDVIDRRSPFLPLSSVEHKKSPVEVCAAFLTHLKSCWERERSDLPFNEQTILVTVPASFDPGARSLVQEAAAQAGFPEIRLMEEPLAAFYAWLYTHKETWRTHLKVGDKVLVVDIGGGTTDFSLISVVESGGELSLERKAVGNHLLLGGDNIDLTLAHLVQQKLSVEMDDWQMQSLVHACRSAKEALLGEAPPDHAAVTVQGRGSSLIGGSLHATLERAEIERTLVDGFFPTLSLSESLWQEKRSGLAKIGLPYARDPRITAQLAHFLAQSGGSLPSAVLFNGGTMKAAAFRKRILDQLSLWKGDPVTHLVGADLDYGVSRGAAYYGWSRAHEGIRVKAPICRSYYIGIEAASPAIPGAPPALKKIRLVPFGLEEGTSVTLEDQTFSLYLDEPAIFRFFSQNSPASPDLTELHPIETVLHAQGDAGKVVLVKLTAVVTELGVLELWCVAADGRKWKLEYDTRGEG